MQAKAFCEMAQVPVKELSTYKTETIEGFVGTMYAFTDYNERIKNDPDTFTYYIPSTDYTATYYTTDFKVDGALHTVPQHICRSARKRRIFDLYGR